MASFVEDFEKKKANRTSTKSTTASKLAATSPLNQAKSDAATGTTVKTKISNAKTSGLASGSGKSQAANQKKQEAKSEAKSKLTLSEADLQLPSLSQKNILDAKLSWEEAKAAGDKEGMAKAHEQAEKIRARYGYSGGTSGSEKIEKAKLTDQDKRTLTQEGQNALLSALTLGNERRAGEVRSAKGFQKDTTQKDSEGRTIFTQTKEEREKAGEQFLAGLEAAGKGVAGSLLSIHETFNQAMRNYNRDRWGANLQANANNVEMLEARLAQVEAGEGNPKWGTAAEIRHQLGAAKAAREALDDSTIVDPNLTGQRLLRESQEAAREALEGKTGLSALLTKAGISGAQMLPGVAASFIPGVGPALGLGLMGAQAAGSKMGELNEQSYQARLLSYMQGGSPEDYGEVTPGESFVRGLISGGIESLTEKIPLGNLLRVVKGSGGAEALVSIAKQMGYEATEESASYVMNFLADKLAQDPNATFSVKDLAESAAIGAISGAGFGGAAVGVNAALNRTSTTPMLDALLETSGIKPTETAQNEQEQAVEQPKQETSVAAETPAQKQEEGGTALDALAQRHADVMARIQAAKQDGSVNDPAVYEGFRQELTAINQEEARLVQAERQEAGEVSRNFGTEESHIDNRTAEDVSDRSVKTFQFDHPQLHSYFSEAAKALKEDAEYSVASQRAAKGEGTIVQRSEQLAQAEGLGLTRQEIIKVCNDLIADKGQENYAAAKKVELILDEMLSKGYLPNGATADARVGANEAYLEAKQAIPGAVTGFDQYLRDNSLALELGETTEEELRAEFEAMGAASEGFDPYTNAMNKYGTLEPGENPARMVDVPLSTDGQNRVRQWAQTVMEAEVTSEETVQNLEQDIINNGFSYKRKTDRQSLEKAVNVIENYGIDPALAQWQEVVDGRRSAGKDDIVLAECLYINAERTGDRELARKLAAEIAAEGTRMGQGIQALRLLKKTTKEGKVYYIRKSVEYVKQELQSRMGDKAKDITIPDQLVQDFMDAQGKVEEDNALDAIYASVAEQIPPTLNDRMTAWRYFAMLGNPKTHIKNMIGNVMFGGVYRGSNQVSALMQRAFLAEENRTRSFIADAKAKEFAKADWEEAKGILSGDKYSMGYSAIQRKVQDRSLGVFNKAANFSSDAMERADTWAKKGQYIQSMAKFITARGWDPANLTSEQLETARSHALLDAQRATFTEASDLAKTLTKLEQKGKAWNVAIGGVMPFKGVPINIAKQGFNLSPAGLIKSLTYDLYKVKTGERTAAEAIDHISQGLTGTSAAAIGAFLAAQGILRGMDSDDEKERLLDEASGEQEYSLDLEALSDFFGIEGPEYTYTIDWAAPAVIPLFFGAEVYQGVLDAAKELGEEDFPLSKALEIALNAAVNTFEPMMNMTMLSGISDTLRAAVYSGPNEAVGVALETAEGFVSQFVPTLLGQIARTIDDTRRSTFGDKNEGFPGLQKFIQQQENKIPGLSQGNIPYLNVWGEEDKTENRLLLALENFVSPGYIAKKSGSSTEEELKRLHELGYEDVLPGMTDKSTKVNDKYVTADQWLAIQTERGQTAKTILDSFIGSEQYNALTDDEKAKFVKKVLEYGADRGKVKGGADADDTFSRWQEAAQNAKEAVGLDEAEIIAASAYLSVLDYALGDETKASIKQGQFEQWVDSNANWNDEQKAYVKDNVKLYVMRAADSGKYNNVVSAGYSNERAEELLTTRSEYADSNNGLYEFVISQESDYAAQEKLYNAFKDKGTTKTWAELSKEQAPVSSRIQTAKANVDSVMDADRQTAFADAVGEFGTGSRYAVYQGLMSIEATDEERRVYYEYIKSQRTNPWKASWAEMKANGGFPS